MTMMAIWILLGLIVLGFSARWNWWRLPKAGIPVLMYHKIGNPPEGSQLKKLWVSVEKFKQQMTYLKSQGYTPIHFADLFRYWDNQTPLPEKPVILTFDDGYQNNHSLAAPILKEFNYKATLFVVTNTVGGDNKWHDPKSETRISMISWNELKDLQKSQWEIGSHTLNHPRLTRLGLDDVSHEMEKSKEVLSQQLAQETNTFAYPYGDGEDAPAVRERAQKAGYRVAVGVHAGKWTADQMKASPYNVPRVFVRGDENLLDFALQLSRGQSRL